MIKKWCAAVAKPAIVTCFARQKIRNIGYGFSLHKEDIMIECACVWICEDAYCTYNGDLLRWRERETEQDRTGQDRTDR